MRQLAERELTPNGPAAHPPADRRRRSVTVNLAESPLGWLRARGLVSAAQFDAGERLRADFERASLGPRVTMHWEARVDGHGGGAPDPHRGQVAGKARFDAAIAAGPGLADIMWRVICAGETLPDAERALGWPVRGGRLVLTLALDRLAAHYGIR
jgi:hypothetical protein